MPQAIAIVKEPNKVLRKIAAEIPPKAITTPKIRKLIEDMKETLKNTPTGVGLAAPQVGESLRLFIVSEEAEEIDKAEKKTKSRRSDWAGEDGKERPYEPRDWKYYVFINPVVDNISRKKIEDAEGCLSVKEKYGIVRRHEKITMTAYDEHGKKFTRGAANFFARVMQHEIDHLNGILFVDKVEQFLEPMKK